MSIIKGTEKIVNPLQESKLNKKGLCDYVINIANGCLHGCTFCYVPSTPVIRTKQTQLKDKGVEDPQMNWGQYLFVREEIPEKLEEILKRKKTWKKTNSGKGVVLLCSGTDPYQDNQTAYITRETIKILLKYNKRVRILTRGLLWLKDVDILKNDNVTVGMSLPTFDDQLSRKIEPWSPLPRMRYKTLLEGHKAGLRLYIAMAPTPPTMTLDNFRQYLEKIMLLEPEVIFWEPINARGTNGKRMLAAGLDMAISVMSKNSWAENFKKQWEYIETAASDLGCQDKIHIWPDPQLKEYINEAAINEWLYRPTIEKWLENPESLANPV